MRSSPSSKRVIVVVVAVATLIQNNNNNNQSLLRPVLALSSRYNKISTSSSFDTSSSSPPTSIQGILPSEPPPTVGTIDLGLDRFVKLLVPSDSRQLVGDNNRSNNSGSNTKVHTNDGSGDVIWPAGFALARLIAHRPSLVDNKDVLELGCGLGLVSAAACKYGRPHHVALTDQDRSVLGFAYASSTQLQRSRASVSRCQMVWEDPTTWPAQDYDLLLASDVLYDKSSILPLVQVLKHYLCERGDSSTSKDNNIDGRGGTREKRAIIVDPVSQINRDAFFFAAHKAGLFVETQELSATSGTDSDLVVLNVSPFAI